MRTSSTLLVTRRGMAATAAPLEAAASSEAAFITKPNGEKIPVPAKLRTSRRAPGAPGVLSTTTGAGTTAPQEDSGPHRFTVGRPTTRQQAAFHGSLEGASGAAVPLSSCSEKADNERYVKIRIHSFFEKLNKIAELGNVDRVKEELTTLEEEMLPTGKVVRADSAYNIAIKALIRERRSPARSPAERKALAMGYLQRMQEHAVEPTMHT